MQDHDNHHLAAIAPAYPSIESITPYKTGKPIEELSRELGLKKIIKLASNENPLGFSSYAAQAIADATTHVFRYPDGSGHALKSHLINHHANDLAITADQVTLGNGSNDILDLITRSFVSCQDAVVFSQYAFAVYGLATKSVGAKAIVVPAHKHGMQAYGHDLQAMCRVIAKNKNTKVVFLANPNNPTGTYFNHEQLIDFLQQVPPWVLVVLDEAYVEYAATQAPSNIKLLKRFTNLIIVRTFSKAYGLAGLRLGYALSSQSIADYLNRLRHPFNVNVIAQAAAIAALSDQDFIDKTRAHNQKQMAVLRAAFDQMAVPYLSSHANFITINVAKNNVTKAGASSGQRVFEHLLHRGIITRALDGYHMHDWLRVTVGLADENRMFLNALHEVLD